MTAYISSKAKLTKRLVDATAPRPDADVVVWDTEITEFRLKVRPTGRKTYELRYTPRGSRTQRQIKIGVHGSPWTVEEARDRAMTLLREVHAGHDPLEEKQKIRDALTVADLVVLYLRDGPADKPDKTAASWNVDRYNLQHHAVPLLGKKIADALKPEDLARWQAQVARGETAKKEKSEKKRGVINVRGGPGAAARAIRVVATMLEWARLRGFVTVNAAADVKKISDGVRERYLSDEEAGSLWKAIDELASMGALLPRLAIAFKLFLLTGARLGEIRGLKWSEVDFEKSIIFLPPARHKSGRRSKMKAIQIPEIAIELLRPLRQQATTKHVFPAVVVPPKRKRSEPAPAVKFVDEPMAKPASQWNRVLKHAGVTDASFHVLRHTFASQVMADQADVYTLSKMLGHARVTTTERYIHFGQTAQAQAASRVADRYTKPPVDEKEQGAADGPPD